MGQANEISSSEEERIEYSLPVSVGLERTGYMPGYAQGEILFIKPCLTMKKKREST